MEGYMGDTRSVGRAGVGSFPEGDGSGVPRILTCHILASFLTKRASGGNSADKDESPCFSSAGRRSFRILHTCLHYYCPPGGREPRFLEADIKVPTGRDILFPAG